MADFYNGVSANIPLPYGYTSIANASRDGADFTPFGTISTTTGGATWWAATAADMAGRVIHLSITGSGVPNADLVITTEADYTGALAGVIAAIPAEIASAQNGVIAAIPGEGGGELELSGVALESDLLAVSAGVQALQRGLLGSVYLQVAPSDIPGSMILTFDTGITGLTGTVGFTVYDSSGSIVQARTTGTVPYPIMEMPTGSGVYYCVVPYSLVLGNIVVWDTGGDTPLSASEAFPSDLVGLITGGPKSKTLREIASQALNTYPGWNRDDEMSPLLYAEDGWRQFVHIGGNLYTNTAILTTVPGQAIYSLPADFRLITERNAVAMQATPQYLTEVSAQEAMSDPNWQHALGVPTAFYFPDPMHIGLSPTPAAEVAITIRYDAEAPSPMSYDTPLPVPALYEHAFFGYARSHMAETMGNDRLAAIEYNKFKELLATWKAGKQTRMVAPSQATPYTTRPNGLARSPGGYEEER